MKEIKKRAVEGTEYPLLENQRKLSSPISSY